MAVGNDPIGRAAGSRRHCAGFRFWAGSLQKQVSIRSSWVEMLREQSEDFQDNLSQPPAILRGPQEICRARMRTAIHHGRVGLSTITPIHSVIPIWKAASKFSRPAWS